MTETWLSCWISPGQFSVEYAVGSETYDGTGFSLFASVEDVECASSPREGERVPGWLRVTILESRDGLHLINLPQQTLENGHVLTVRANQVECRPTYQEA